MSERIGDTCSNSSRISNSSCSSNSHYNNSSKVGMLSITAVIESSKALRLEDSSKIAVVICACSMLVEPYSWPVDAGSFLELLLSCLAAEGAEDALNNLVKPWAVTPKTKI